MDEAQAKRFLRAHYPAGVAAVTALRLGEWSSAFSFERKGAGYVVRFSRFEEDFAKDRLATRLASTELPIPRVLERGSAAGGFFAISERAQGESLDEQDRPRMAALLPSLFAVLDAARAVDLSATSGYGRWGRDRDRDAPHRSWREALLDVANGRAPAGRTAGWRERLARSPIGLAPFEEVYASLEELADPGSHVRHLVHADLLNHNVLVSSDGVSAVLDWGNSMYGDFLYDIAWFTFWAPWYPQWEGIDLRSEAIRHYDAIGLDVPCLDERLRACELHIGLDGMAYSAFRERWDDVATTAARTLAFARSSPALPPPQHRA